VPKQIGQVTVTCEKRADVSHLVVRASCPGSPNQREKLFADLKSHHMDVTAEFVQTVLDQLAADGWHIQPPSYYGDDPWHICAALPTGSMAIYHAWRTIKAVNMDKEEPPAPQPLKPSSGDPLEDFAESIFGRGGPLDPLWRIGDRLEKVLDEAFGEDRDKH